MMVDPNMTIKAISYLKIGCLNRIMEEITIILCIIIKAEMIMEGHSMIIMEIECHHKIGCHLNLKTILETNHLSTMLKTK